MKKSVLLFVLAAACVFCLKRDAFAQLVSPNIFLQGQWLEVGINQLGAFGVSTSPAGYHAHPLCCPLTWAPGQGLGEVYDYGHDGWSTGSMPFMGDYTYAGTPFEGWEVQIGGGRAQAFTSSGALSYTTSGLTLTGANTSYSDQCGSMTGNWAGTAGGTLNIQMQARVDTNASWAVITVKMINTGSTVLPNIYYLRSCDPDGDETWPSGTYTTNNWVTYQDDAMHRVLVSASGLTYAYSYMGLGTIDSRAVAFVYNYWPILASVDLSTCWNQTYTPATYAVGVHVTADIAIGLVFNLGNLPPGDSTSFSYSYIFGNPSDLDSTISAPTAANNGPLCAGDSLKLFGTAMAGGCAYTWNWSGPGGFTSLLQNPVIPDVSAAQAGTYVVTRTSGATTDTANTLVVVNPKPAPITGPATICIGATATLLDAIAGGAWSSSNPLVATISAGGVVTGVTAGSCTITYELTTGCYVTVPFAVVEEPAPFPGAALCAGHTALLTDAITGGNWTSGNPSVATIGDASGALTGVAAGTAVITYSFGGACFVTAIVTVDPAPNAGTITGPSGVCIGQEITLSDTVSGGTWSSGNNSVATVLSGMVSGIASGTAIISYTVTNGCGTATAIKIVTVTPMPLITGPLRVCAGDSIAPSANVAGGTWSGSNNSIAAVDSVNGIVRGIKAGTDPIFYTIGAGCYATVVVTVNPTPNPGNISGSAILCPGGTAQLAETVPGGKWHTSNADVTIDSLTGAITAIATGTCVITYTTPADSNGCVGIGTFTITIAPPSFVVNAVVTDASCYGKNDGSISVTVSGGSGYYGYLWQNGAATTSIADLSPGPYSLSVKDTTNKCTKTTTYTITQPDSLQITAKIKDDVCRSKLGDISVTVSGGTAPYTYLWADKSASNEISGLLAGTYTLTITDNNGCPDSASVYIKDSCVSIIIHNAVSPNGDGINDTWVIEGIQSYPANEVHVFDKWGDELYGQHDYKNEWYGKDKQGKLVPDGTYYYLVKLNTSLTPDGVNTFTGYLMIKR